MSSASTATAPMTGSRPARSGWRTRLQARRGRTLLAGTSAEGERWSLQAHRSGPVLRAQLHVDAPGTGPCAHEVGALSLLPGSTGRALSGRGPEGPAWLVLRLRPDVHTVRVLLSDGTHRDLAAVPVVPVVPGRPGLSGLPASGDLTGALHLSVLVYPRPLDVHRVDLHDVHGHRLPEDA